MSGRALAGAVVLLVAADASAAEPERVFGLGSAGGGGVGAVALGTSNGRLSTSSVVNAIAKLPTLEAQLFLGRRGWSIDVTVPITNMLVVSGVVGGFYFNLDDLFDLNLGRGAWRMVLGPGLGTSVVVVREASGASLRVPAEVGLEWLTPGRSFGIKLMARPWFEVAGGAAQTYGGGFTLLLGLSGYIVRHATEP